MENVGNAALNFPIPSTGNNPSIAANFTLNDNGASACTVLSAGSSEPGTLAAGASCQLPISFAPTAAGALSGSLVLTDNNLNAAAPGYATQSIALSGTGTQATPTITWATPAAITYGTALSGTQLNASSTVAGSFAYSPAAGTVLGAGQQTLTVTFAPTDTTDYTAASATVTLTVNQAAPTITWATPAAIIYGTALSATQLNASSTVAGSFAYSPATGTVLGAGAQTLTATFTPTETEDYTTATANVTLTVNQATPTITWATLAAITDGTALSATQLDASTTVAGSFSYSPSAGTVLGIGPHTLTATFTPADTTNYTTATATVTLTVIPATPALTLGASPNPAFLSNPVTFTATLSYSATAPTGTVAFFDGTTQIGSGVVTAGVATSTTSALTTGTHSITAVYSGDSNYTPAAIGTLSENIEDFTLTLLGGSGAGTANVPLGGQATYPLVITPVGGSKLPGAVSLSITGLPSGMTAVFSPSTVAANSAASNVTLVVMPPGQSAAQSQHRPLGGSALPVALGLFLLPFAGILRKTAYRWRSLAVLALAGAALAAGLAGCQQSTYTPQSFSLAVTAASGPLSHSIPLKLIVQ